MAIDGHAARQKIGTVAQSFDRSPNCRQLTPRRRSRPGLHQPALRRAEVGEGAVGTTQFPPHCAVALTAGVGDWKFLIGADAINPGLHLGRGHQTAGGNISVSLGDHLGFPGQPILPASLAFRVGRPAVVGANGVHRSQYSPASSRSLVKYRRAQRCSRITHWQVAGPSVAEP